VPVNSEELVALFSQHGLVSFVQSTRTLIALLSKDGQIITWNSAFETIKEELPSATHLRDFLSLACRTIFDLQLSTVTHDHVVAQCELELGQGNRLLGYSCHLYSTSDSRILFIAEPSHAVVDLASVSEELQRTKLNLERKETELHAVLSLSHEVSTTDSLTSLPNRLQIMAELQEAVEFADKYGTLVSILLLDIDHFKKINDLHGYTVGDEVLKGLSAELRKLVNVPESIGRLGGEEFLIILPHTTSGSAVEYTDHLCEQVRALSILVADQELSITVSVGIAQHKLKQENWQAFLNRADRALYQAKERGRNQSLVSDE